MSAQEPDVDTRWRRLVARENPWDVLRREIDRSRRHDRPLTLVRLAGRAPISRRRDARSILATLRRSVRTIDSVWIASDGIYVLLPESDPDAAQAMLARLHREAPAAVPADIAAHVAAYPGDGLTVNALRAAVRSPPLPGEAHATSASAARRAVASG